MRQRKEIESDGKRVECLLLETLLDVRDLLIEKDTYFSDKLGITVKPRGRPKKNK
jgi:hypothetical protein